MRVKVHLRTFEKAHKKTLIALAKEILSDALPNMH